MKVELAKLKPNSHRDFKIDPIDPEKVQELIQSIKQDGFWSGVVARKNGKDIEIAAGHTRVKAAIQAGETHAEIFVGSYDDQAMIRIYARENATQRGNSGLAIAGSVASSIKYLLKGILTNDKKVTANFSCDLEKVRRNLGNERGLGYVILLEFLTGIPGIHKSTIEHQLANLKASGDYARIVAEVDAEIAKEDAEKAAKTPEEPAVETPTRTASKEAVTASSQKTPTFDFEGVAKHLKNENQLRVFREVCERKSMKKYLPVDKQAALAKELVRKATATGDELSGTYIRDNMVSMMMDAAQVQGKLDKEARKALEEQDARIKWMNTSHHLARNVAGITKDGHALIKLMSEHPGIHFKVYKELELAVEIVQEIVNKLAIKLGITQQPESTNANTRNRKLSLGNRS